MDYVLIVYIVSNIITPGLAIVTVDYPPIYLSRPIVFLKGLSCNIYDIKHLEHVTLEGLINFRKPPEEIRNDGQVILHIYLYNGSNEFVNVRFRVQFYDLPCTFDVHLDWFQYRCEYMMENEVLRFLASIALYPDVHPEDFDKIYSLHYQSNNYTISSEERMDFPIFGGDPRRKQITKSSMTILILVTVIANLRVFSVL